MRTIKTTTLLLVSLGFLLGAISTAAQNVVIDRPVRAGDLVFFPAVDNDKELYYAPTRARLGVDENGRPKFSFLRWVDNVRSAADKPEAREGEGGGIVHAVVQLGVTEEQLRDAQREVQRTVPGAQIRGPLIFKSGKFSLVSSFANEKGDLTDHVAGVGAAALLDGDSMAVSIQLTKKGAKILWESFETPTPDISFSFEMAIDGYLSPKRALIEADFDQIYNHKAFAAGIASKYLSGEIRGAFDDLQRTGAIKLTQVGDDKQLQSLIDAAYTKITAIMFQPMNGSGTPNLKNLVGSTAGPVSVLDKATSLLTKNRTETRKANEGIRKRNAEHGKANAAVAGSNLKAERFEASAKAAEQRAAALESRATRAASRVAKLRPSTGTAPTVVALRKRAEEHAKSLRALATKSRGEASKLRAEADKAAGQAAGSARAAQGLEKEKEAPSFAIVAAFEMKRVRQRGKFTIDLNKYTATSMTLRFDENIGDLRALKNDKLHFREVNIDAPLYTQRELVAFVDGLNAKDFGNYINFVTVQMRKKHASGDETLDEVRIDRNNFNREGNNFKLLYGWRGDNDRQKWLDYEFKTQWSFFGGSEVEVPWSTTTSGAINLAPPYQRRRVALEADPDLMPATVRAITVKVFYRLGDQAQTQQTTLNVSKKQLSGNLDFMLPADQFEYEYEILWRLRGNRTATSGRLKTSEAVLFVDEVPEA